MNTAEPAPLFENYSVQDLQRHNNIVYEKVNGRNFDLSDFGGRLSRFGARVLLRVRQANTGRTGYHLCMMLSWLFAIANRLLLDMHVELTTSCAVKLPADTPLATLQEVFTARHQDATLQNASLCLAEKIQGIVSEIEYFRETHEEVHFHNAAKRMAQSIEALCVVASRLDIQLNEEFKRAFPNGACTTCRAIPCKCGFRADKVM